jgi:hypothetical protein
MKSEAMKSADATRAGSNSRARMAELAKYDVRETAQREC